LREEQEAHHSGRLSTPLTEPVGRNIRGVILHDP
jgi:hypothetical protein